MMIDGANGFDSAAGFDGADGFDDLVPDLCLVF
jgi:hypothetical protein